MFNVPIEVIAFIGILIGVIARTYFPYKTAQEEGATRGAPITFDYRYLLTALFSILITSALVFSTFTIPELGEFQVFIAALIFAYGTDAILNRYAST